jgi:Ca2+/Na+ antiporter
VVIVVGADVLVGGAAGAGRSLGVSDAIVGLTIVAIGTSAPELVTTLLSTLRGEPARVERVQPGAHSRTHGSVCSDRG